MSKKTEIETRVIAPMQSVGRCGKSTLVQALIEFLNYGEVEKAVIDADGEHKTLSAWFPKVAHMPFVKSQDWLPILNHCGSCPVEIIDFPAQATDELLAGLKQFKADEIFAGKKVKLTIPIFASDERTAMASAAKIVQATNSYADYLLILSPARYTSETFLASEKLMELIGDVPRITLPAITEVTLGEIDKASKQQKKSLTFSEALGNIPIASKMEMETWINGVMLEMEDAISLLLPDPKLMKNQFKRTKAKAIEEIDPFDL